MAASVVATHIKPLVFYPSNVLRAVCSPIVNVKESTPLLEALKRSCQHYQGLGLAAPQLNYTLRAFALLAPRAWTVEEVRGRRRSWFTRPTTPTYLACVNPKVLEHSKEVVVGVESCLSVPNRTVLVQRSQRVLVSYTDEQGEVVERELSGLPAVVFQHELDHLDGVLLIDRHHKLEDGAKEEEVCRQAVEAFESGLEKHYR